MVEIDHLARAAQMVDTSDAAAAAAAYVLPTRKQLDGRQTMTHTEHTERTEVLVVGAGQAGLSAGFHLRRRGREFLIVDGNRRIGDSWRQRWGSLKLYSPASRDGLPGMPFPAPRSSYPTAAEMADYLEAYAAHHELPVRTGVRIDSLSEDEEGFVARAGALRILSKSVIVASGVFQKAHVPEFATKLDAGITQLHSSAYRNQSQLQPGPVLVVGASHSGSDLAYESAAGHQVILSGRDTGQLPAPIETRRGRLLFRGLFFAGTHILTVDRSIGRKMRTHVRHGGAPLLRYRRRELRAAGVELVTARAAGVQDGLPVLEDGRVLDVRNVIWCTGFRPDFSWLHAPVEFGDDGYPVQYRGASSSSPGLYFTGLPFLHSFASMLIGGAGRDAERVVEQIAAQLSRKVTPVIGDPRLEARAS